MADELRPRPGAQDRPPAHRPSTHQRRRSGGRPWQVLLWAVLLVVLGAGAGWYFLSFRGPGAPGPVDEFPPEAVQEEPLAGDRAVLVVFPEWDGAGFVTEERQIPSRDRPGEDLLGVMRVLCDGPAISGSISALPRGTRALAAFVDPGTQAVVLDFSRELVTGHPGGSLAETATLTSILRTVALNFPATRSCVILVEGEQVETLAGHLDLARPLDPQRWL